MNKEKRRKRLQAYFGPQLNVKAQLRYLGMATILAFILVVGASYQEMGLVAFGVIGFIYVIIFITTFFRILRYYWSGILDDTGIEHLIDEDLAEIAGKSTKKLRLDDLPPDNPLIDTIYLRGLILDNKTGLPREDIPARKGKHGFYQYAANRLVAFHFTQYLIGVYVCDYNSLESKEHAVLREETFESYYGDIVSFWTQEKDRRAEGLLTRFNLKRFKLSKLLDAAESILDQSEPPKGTKFVNFTFAMVATNGQQLGTSVGILRELDSKGEVKEHETDEKINTIRLLLRQKKEEGTLHQPVIVRQT